jgi:glycosyltransferase involved in cell wall biosynthesis
MRIVFLNPSGQIGGAERSLLDIIASIRAREPGWELALVATADGPLVGAAEGLGVKVTVLPFPASLAGLGDGGAGGGAAVTKLLAALPATARYAKRLRSVLREWAPDVIHSNGFKMHVLGLWTRPRGRPVVWHVHDFVRRRPVMSALLRAHAGRCAAVIANSRSVAADVTAVVGKRVPVHAVHNAVDLRVFSPEGPMLDLDGAAGWAPAAKGVIRVGLVATMGWWKGHETFLRAISLLPADLTVRAYVVGGAVFETTGSLRSFGELRTLAADLGVADRVGFTGYVSNPAAAMRALDVVVHASTEPEPFGLVIAEAMACGRAVIVSDAGGAAELFTSGVDALGHSSGDAAALAGQIEALVVDGALRRRLASAARATAERNFDRDRLASELIPIYMAARGSTR